MGTAYKILAVIMDMAEERAAKTLGAGVASGLRAKWEENPFCHDIVVNLYPAYRVSTPSIPALSR